MCEFGPGREETAYAGEAQFRTEALLSTQSGRTGPQGPSTAPHSISHRLLLRLLLGAAILQPYGATVGGPSGTVLQTFELVVYI